MSDNAPVALGALVLWTMAASSSWAAEPPTAMIVKPGAGYLVGDPKARIPLAVLIRDDRGPVPASSVTVKSASGGASDARIAGKGRVLFYYRPPEQARSTSDAVDLTIIRPNGATEILPLTLDVGAQQSPPLSLDLTPAQLVAGKLRQVSVHASANHAADLSVHASHGEMQLRPATQQGVDRALEGTFRAPDNLPTDAPSHLLVLAAASGDAGFAAELAGLSVAAKLRVSVSIDPGSFLTLQGAETTPKPVQAKGDGRTVIEALVRYGAAVRAHQVKGRKKKEVPLTLSAGVVPAALAAPIPGQDVADNGTGPTILVAVPPSPFGGAPIWPELTLEGANLVARIKLARDLMVLVIERPRHPGPVTVVADGTPVATLPFRSAPAALLSLDHTGPRVGERAALEIEVRDLFGNPTDQPPPTAKLEDGTQLKIERLGAGRYRTAIPKQVPGSPGDERMITVEIEPLPGSGPSSADFTQERLTVALDGPPPAVRPEEAEDPGAATAQSDGPRRWIGVAAGATAGTTFGGQLILGGGALAELRPPILTRQLLVRAGVEAFRSSSPVRVQIGDATLEGRSTLAGVVFPVGAGWSFVKSDSFELVALAALELRSESASITVGPDRAGGGSRFAVAARLGGGAAFALGPGALIIELAAGGLGANAEGFTQAGTVAFEGSLAHVRLDLGFRLWL